MEKCNSCKNGLDGRNGNGHQPCACQASSGNSDLLVSRNCHMHPAFLADDCIGCKLMLAESEISDQYDLIIELRDGLSEIYNLRGEDDLIARIAPPLIEKAC